MKLFHKHESSVHFQPVDAGGDGLDQDIAEEQSNPANQFDLRNVPTEKEQHDYWSGILAMGDVALNDSQDQES